jgi:hypothetical protein
MQEARCLTMANRLRDFTLGEPIFVDTNILWG